MNQDTRQILLDLAVGNLSEQDTKIVIRSNLKSRDLGVTEPIIEKFNELLALRQYHFENKNHEEASKWKVVYHELSHEVNVGRICGICEFQNPEPRRRI